MKRFSLLLILGIGCGCLAIGFDQATAQEDDLAADGLARGWITHVQQEDRSIQRIDVRPVLDVSQARVDPRLDVGTFQLTWDGYLESEARGEYEFAAFVEGEAKVTLNDATLIDAECAEPKWVISESTSLPFDLHPIRVQFQSLSDSAQLRLYWKGPNFDWEPLPRRRMMHELDDTYDPSWERGRQIVASHHCSQCHDVPLGTETAALSPLFKAASTIEANWLVARLMAKESEHESDPNRQMPFFDLSQADAVAITSYLFASTEGDRDDQGRDAKTSSPNKNGNLDSQIEGDRLFHTMGCLACHQMEEIGSPSPFGGGSLTYVADKRPPGFFEAWLKTPSAINPNHRMPEFTLTDQEVQHLGTFLASRRSDTVAADIDLSFDAKTLERGETLFGELRCASCHQRDESPADPIPLQDRGLTQIESTCLGNPDPAQGRPGYRMTESEIKDVANYLSEPVHTDQLDIPFLLAQQNCNACHQRDGSAGLVDLIPEVIKRDDSLSTIASAMKPPLLDGVGDKLHQKSLFQTIQRGGNPRRPWLHVRMPKYRLSDEDIEQLSSWLIAADRMPDGLIETAATIPNEIVPIVGPRLVTPTGFGCTSCHQVGSVEPVNAPLNAMGPDLSQIGNHLRHDWFRRWVANPSRFEPGMEMPSIQQPVRGVLHEELDQQLAAVWQVLNTPGFEPPRPEPVRIVRQTGADSQALAHVLTDVTRTDRGNLVKPLIVGLGNRHNVMFDLATGRLERWWIGDTLRQHTEGKTWFWEVGGPTLWHSAHAEDQSDWILVTSSGELNPVRVGQFRTEASRWEHDNGRLSLNYRLTFSSDASDTNRELVFSETLSPTWTDGQGISGWQRAIEVTGLAADESLLMTGSLEPSPDAPARHTNRLNITQPRPVVLNIARPQSIAFDQAGRLRIPAGDDGELSLVLSYTTQLPVDRVPASDVEFEGPLLETIEVAPGFESVRLPIDADWMPTAMSWGPNGDLYVTSLKGRVWRLSDGDGDGIEDQAIVFGDELSAPFGVHAHSDGVDVIHKSALVRLLDRDQDGFPEVTQSLVSGWGHSQDYHDWAVGLPSDANGNYYIALACQQDDRSPAAANLRGEVLKLVPDGSERFRIEPLSTGHRFPTGIARNQEGALFVTDNQGNYNPFNELNHVRPGGWFGFINRLDKPPGPDEPHLAPSINIPHPWTRSVNGICFLSTPDSDSNHSSGFGPFEGHLVGCEYDTQRLVRMSLQKVGESYQGAVYPLTYETPRDGQTLLGPLSCAVSPDGRLYVGNIRDSGWGGSNNIGSMVRMSFNNDLLPCGISEVTANRDGFTIRFTKPVDEAKAKKIEAYRVTSYRRISTPAYGGDDVDRRGETPTAVEVAEDGLSVHLTFAELREGFVYQFDLADLSTDGEFFPGNAYYSLNAVPETRR